MKETGILFNGDMVRTILDGRKTMTRRVVSKNNSSGSSARLSELLLNSDKTYADPWGYLHVPHIDGETIHRWYPKWEVGDRLWVRETWTLWEDPDDGLDWVLYREGGKMRFPNIQNLAMPNDPFADKWRPSIHMPRWASRIILEITNVRVERLQEITEEDAVKEGAGPEFEVDVATFCCGGKIPASTHVLGFKHLWDSTTDKHPWSSNPLVWVIEFKRV